MQIEILNLQRIIKELDKQNKELLKENEELKERLEANTNADTNLD